MVDAGVCVKELRKYLEIRVQTNGYCILYHVIIF